MKSVSRLIELFTPSHYELSLNLERTARTFSGTVTVNGVTQDGAHDIRFHAKDLTISSALVDGKSANFETAENDELVISHPDIQPGAHLVTIVFSGTITDDMNGIYPGYFEVDGVKQELLATQFESHYARQAFPCIDEPEAKATFNVTLTTEQDVIVLGNMPVAQQTVENDRLITTFQTTPRMSTYLVAWVIGDLQKKTAVTKNGVEVSIWSTKAHDLTSLDFALDIATRTIDFFDDYFGVPYPLPKSDHVALPDFSAGAMENWGLITYREIALLADPQQSTLSTKHYAATVIAHELSHQWFGNLVTMKWWNDLWLNESFANMMEYVAIDALEPSWNVWLDFASGEVISALRRDSLDGVQAIQTAVNHPDEISTIFDPSIVYAKGGRLLRMLQAYIGTDALRAGLKDYFETHQYSNTQADDLWAALSTASGKDIARFMHAWMTEPGFPVVSATDQDGTITLTQEQFFIGPHKPSNRQWPIPLHGAAPEIPETLNSGSVRFHYNQDIPFRLNTNATAHFITQYDESLRTGVIGKLQTLSSVDKLGFLHDQLLLAKSGRQSYAAIIPLLTHFKDETNESVWDIIALAINELRRFVDPDSDEDTVLKGVVAEVVSTQYGRLGWDETPGEDENDTKLRSTILSLALYGDIPEALAEAEARFHTTDLETLNPELRVTILANAVRRQLDPNLVDMLITSYPRVINSELRDDIAAALTAAKDQSTLHRLITLLSDTSFIRPQDFTHWFVWLLRSRFSRDEAWQWTRDNWHWITKTFQGDSHYDMFPRYIAGSLMNRKQLEEYKAFFTPLESEVALARNIGIGYTELEGTVDLLEHDGPVVRKALLDLK